MLHAVLRQVQVGRILGQSRERVVKESVADSCSINGALAVYKHGPGHQSHLQPHKGQKPHVQAGSQTPPDRELCASGRGTDHLLEEPRGRRIPMWGWGQGVARWFHRFSDTPPSRRWRSIPPPCCGLEAPRESCAGRAVRLPGQRGFLPALSQARGVGQLEGYREQKRRRRKESHWN